MNILHLHDAYKLMRFWVALPVYGLCLAWLGTAVAGERPLKTGDTNPALLYHNYCSVCHGDRGDGHSRASRSLVPPPRDFTSATNLTRDVMIWTVKNGKPGTAMSSWKTQLNDKEIEAVVDYIRNGFMQAALDPMVAKGRDIYTQNCMNCHGESGKGPLIAEPRLKNTPDLSSEKARAEYKRERLVTAIAHGKPGTAMEGYGKKLHKEELEAVADYIEKVIMTAPITSLSGKNARGGQAVAPAPQTSATAGDPPLPNGLVGNLKRGEKAYMTNCSACHGIKGDAQGPRAYFITPKPRNFIDPSSAMFNRPMLFASISNGKPGTVMPAWSKVLSDQEIADIAEFVYTNFIRASAAKREGSK